MVEKMAHCTLDAPRVKRVWRKRLAVRALKVFRKALELGFHLLSWLLLECCEVDASAQRVISRLQAHIILIPRLILIPHDQEFIAREDAVRQDSVCSQLAHSR